MTNETNNETISPTEKVLKDTNKIIQLMEPLKPFDVSEDALGGMAIHYESDDKNRTIWISVLNENDYRGVLLHDKVKLLMNPTAFYVENVPHLKRFIDGYHEDYLENNFIPKPKVWLHDIYTFVFENKDEEAMDLLFTKIGDLLDGGEYGKVNGILPTINLRKLNLNLLVGLLSITRCGTNSPSDFLASYYEPDLLPYRPTLVEEIKKVIYEIEPSERIDKLMKGLR